MWSMDQEEATQCLCKLSPAPGSPVPDPPWDLSRGLGEWIIDLCKTAVRSSMSTLTNAPQLSQVSKQFIGRSINQRWVRDAKIREKNLTQVFRYNTEKPLSSNYELYTVVGNDRLCEHAPVRIDSNDIVYGSQTFVKLQVCSSYLPHTSASTIADTLPIFDSYDSVLHFAGHFHV